MLWSADYPFEDISDAADWIDAAPISEADRQKIGRTNALKLFKLQNRKAEETHEIDSNRGGGADARRRSRARRAEVSEITIAQQFGVAFLPLMLMERDGLIEKHAKAAGVEVKTNWQKVAGPSVINDGLLSGNVHFGAVGAPSLITLWSRTKTNVGVKGVAAMTSYPLYFVTRNPELKSLKDLSTEGQDRGAVGEDLHAGDHAADGGGRPVRAERTTRSSTNSPSRCRTPTPWWR